MTQPTMEDVAGWLRERSTQLYNKSKRLDNEFGQRDATLKRAECWFDRAAQVEAMGDLKTCDTCRWWRSQGGPGNSDYCSTIPNRIIPGQGPKFGCVHHEPVTQPPVKK